MIFLDATCRGHIGSSFALSNGMDVPVTQSHRKQLQIYRHRAFVLSNSALPQAVDLLSWAVDRYSGADAHDLGVALAELGGLQEQLGNFAGATKAYRQALRLNPELDGALLALARSLLRGEGLRATSELLELEQRVLDGWNGGLIKASKIWSLIIAACCAAESGDRQRARSHAREALRAIGTLGTSEVNAGVDLIPQELEVLNDLAATDPHRGGCESHPAAVVA